MWQWYVFEPADTLCVRGAEPMVMGENHTTSMLFPPLPETISGALRTAVLEQKGVTIRDYYAQNGHDKVRLSIGEAGSPAPFVLRGPVFLLGKTAYVPVPCHWHVDKEALTPGKEVEVIVAKPGAKFDGIKTGHDKLYWARGNSDEVKSLGGYWVATTKLRSVAENSGGKLTHITGWQREDSAKFPENALLSPSALFQIEPRVGIALQENRAVRKSHLYSSHHIRLNSGFRLAFAVNTELPLEKDGILRLGAEQRWGHYRIQDSELIDDGHGSLHMALSSLPVSDKLDSSLIAGSKIQYFGGWDMRKGFHKPMHGYYPAGSVFADKADERLIAI